MRFSVIVCTYNNAHLLVDALRTLAAQTLSDFELLVVDDGSTDNTEEVVHQFRPRFRECVYLRKSHTGLSDSRNFGAQAASGTHIAFLDADDFWSPDYLKVLESILQSNPRAELVCCDGLRIRSSGAVIGPIFPAGLPPICGPITSSQVLFSFFPYTGPSAMAFPKSLYEQVGPFDVRFSGYGDDRHWVIRAVMRGAYCVRLDRKVMLYRHHGANLTAQADRAFDPWLVIYMETLKNWKADSQVEAHARRFTRGFALRLLALSSVQRGRHLLRKALEVFGGDPILEAAYVSTYFGSAHLLRVARAAKHLFEGVICERGRIDLSAPPEAIFKAVS